jgi:1-acyl-sn-glycerol-3-phosphate acyltransferase
MRRTQRLLRIGLHLTAGYVICVVLYPLLPERLRATIRRSWARGVLAILGIRLRVDDLRVAPGSLMVANHVSWLDAVVLNALFDAAVVAKSDTRRWPLLGLMLARNETLFIERRICRALLATNAEIASRLVRGSAVVVFPEGTTTDGADVLAFRPALFQPAVAAGHPVRPLALLYRDGTGRQCAEAAYTDDMSLWHSLRAIAALPMLCVEVRACRALATGGLRRRDAARLSHATVRSRVCGGESRTVPEEDTDPVGSAGWIAADTPPVWADGVEGSRT